MLAETGLADFRELRFIIKISYRYFNEYLHTVYQFCQLKKPKIFQQETESLKCESTFSNRMKKLVLIETRLATDLRINTYSREVLVMKQEKRLEAIQSPR